MQQVGLFNKRLVRNVLASDGVNETVQTFQRMPLDVTFIKTPREFVNVAPEMLFAGLVIDAVQTTAKDGEYAFDAISGDASFYVLVLRVIYSSVIVVVSEFMIGGIFIRMNSRAEFDVVKGKLLHSASTSRNNWLSFDAAIFLAHTNDGNFFRQSVVANDADFHVLILFFAADIDFVHFDNALQDGRIVATRFAETLQDEPCGLLSNADLFRELHRRDAFASGHEQVHGINPLVQGNMTALKDSACADSKIESAGIAAIEAVFAGSDIVFGFAARAGDAVFPEPSFKVFASGFHIGIEAEELESADCAFAHRDLQWANRSRMVLGSQVYNSPIP